MEEYKIYSYIDNLIDAYGSSIELLEGVHGKYSSLVFDMRETLARIEFTANDKYMSGNTDELGREKPFYNISNYRVTVAKTATDIDVKDIKFEPDYLTYSVEAMLYNHELYQFLKDSDFSLFLNEAGKTRPKYGGVLAKKCYDDDNKMEIQVVDWKNAAVDPVDILGNPIIECHYMTVAEFASKMDVWENVKKAIKAHTKLNKNKPARIEILEITGELPESLDPTVEDGDEYKYSTMCIYCAKVGDKKYFLYKEDLDEIEDKYRYLEWERIPGRGLGRGVMEDGFEAQWATNDTIISQKNATDITGKVIGVTSSKKVGGNILSGVDNGHIFQLEDGKTITALNLGPAKMPEFQAVINQWNDQYNKTASTFDANTGEQPPSGTPLGTTQLLNQVANSPFQFQQEVFGIWLNEILNDWILPELKTRILKDHTLVSDFTPEELDIIDKDIATKTTNQSIIDNVLNPQGPEAGAVISPEDQQMMHQMTMQSLKKQGSKREINIPKGYLDVEGKLTANITGELKNKGAVLQSLDSVFKTVVATFNPATGKYAALDNPVLSKLFAQIVEMSGIPLSSVQLAGNTSISPATPQPAQPMTPAAPMAPKAPVAQPNAQPAY